MRQTQPHLFTIASACILTVCSATWLTGCAWPQRVAGVIHEDDRGVVYLEEVQNLEFKASHPVQIEQLTIARLLDGIRVERPGASAVRSKGSRGSGPRVFSADQAQFLGPLLKAALSKAQPEHLVVFRAVETGSSPHQMTAGMLHVHDGTLYVTLTHFQDQVPDKNASKASSELAPSTRMGSRLFHFDPVTAGGPAGELPPGTPDMPLLTSLAVDLGKLAKPAPSPVQQVKPEQGGKEPSRTVAGEVQGPPAPDSDEVAAIEAADEAAKAYRVKLKELQDANRLLGQKMAENQALQRDLRILRERLAEHRSLVDRIKRSKKKGR